MKVILEASYALIQCELFFVFWLHLAELLLENIYSLTGVALKMFFFGLLLSLMLFPVALG